MVCRCFKDIYIKSWVCQKSWNIIQARLFGLAKVSERRKTGENLTTFLRRLRGSVKTVRRLKMFSNCSTYFLSVQLADYFLTDGSCKKY